MTDSTDDVDWYSGEHESNIATYYADQEDPFDDELLEYEHRQDNDLLREHRMAQELMDGNGKKIINRGYADMGVSNKWNPTPFDRLRMILTGFSGLGKTTFIMSDPDSLVLDFEDTARDVPTGAASYVSVPSMERYMEFHDKLCADGPKGSGFKRIVWDTADKFLASVIGKLSDEYGCVAPKTILEYADGRVGYTKISNFYIARLQELFDAGFGWTAVCHIKAKRDEQGVPFTAPMLYASTFDRMVVDAQLMLNISRTILEVPSGRTKPVASTKGGTFQKAIPKQVPRFELNVIPPDSTNDLVKARYVDLLLDQFVKMQGGSGAEDEINPYLNITGNRGMPLLREAWEAVTQATASTPAPARTKPPVQTTGPVAKPVAKLAARK